MTERTDWLPGTRSGQFGMAQTWLDRLGVAARGKKRELMNMPLTGDGLPHSMWLCRRKERISFNGDSGKTVYFCIRYENGKGDVGLWGPVFFAVIP